MIRSLYSKYLELKDRNRKLSDRNMDRGIVILGEDKVKEAIEIAKHLEQTNFCGECDIGKAKIDFE